MDSTAYSILVSRLQIACILWAVSVFSVSGTVFYAFFSFLRKKGFWFLKERKKEGWWNFLRNPVAGPVLYALLMALLILLLSSYCYSATKPPCSEKDICFIENPPPFLQETNDGESQLLATIIFEDRIIVLDYDNSPTEYFHKEDMPELWRKRISLNKKIARVQKISFVTEEGEVLHVYIIRVGEWEYTFFATPFSQ